ncbi:MAG: VCBS repeat-containing protein [Candidatus Limnocylindrales bacterium]
MTSRRFPLLAISVGIALATPTLAGPAIAQHEPGACDRGWFDVERREDIAPEGVIAFEQDAPWVAGGAMLGGGRRAAAVLRGLGEDAVLEEPPLPDTRDSGLMAIAAAGPDEPIWAVGFGRETDFVAAYVTRRDGDGWSLAETIRPDDFNAALTDVDASPDRGAWAAGFLQGRPGDQRPWAVQLREDGRESYRPPLADGERATLAGISVSDEGGVWVAGTALADAAMTPYLAVRDGDGWRRYRVEGSADAALADIDVPGPDHGWAVGHRLDGGTIRPLVLRWDGSAWTEAPVPEVGEVPVLLTSVTITDGIVAVGGTRWDVARGRYAPLAARLVDGEWAVSEGRGGWGMGTVTDIVGDPGEDGWVVARADDGLIARICEAPPDTTTTDAAVDVRPPPASTLEAPVPQPLTGAVAAVDVTEAAGLPTAHQSWGATVADFDGDGRDDLFIGRHGARARLHLNEGGTFVETELRFGGGDRHACAAADIDASGVPDLYCAFGASRGTGTKHNQLWLDPGRSAQLHPSAGGATEPLGRGRQPRFFDIDEDGDLDLFIGQETKRMDGLPSTNRGFLQVGPATFEAAPLAGIDSGLATEAIDIADYDGDGREDVLLVYWDMRAMAPQEGIRLYRNDEGTAFTDVTDETGIASIGERDALLADLDGDGTLDLIQLAPDRVVTSLARAGRFERAWERGVDRGTALAAGDADGDGDIDLYVLQGKSSDGANDVILRNDGDGTAFETIEVPPVRGGSEDDVVSLDYDSDGRTDFLALNGRNSVRGPVQLITLEAAG